MSLAVVHSRALDALRSPQVTVEVHLANGLPSLTLVGLPDTEVRESRERVRAAIPVEVTTLHRLLGSRPDTRHFRHHAGNPLGVDVLVVDEASMVDLEMMAAVLAALPPAARLVLLGDKDQLASVEAGAVLGELCRRAAEGHYTPDTVAWLAGVTGEQVPASLVDAAGTPLDQAVAMLRHSHRFSSGSGIGQLAAAVNGGDVGAVRAVLDAMPPWQGGGNMIVDVTFEKTVYHPAPFRFEAGTGSIADAVGLGAAIDYLDRIGMPQRILDRMRHAIRRPSGHAWPARPRGPGPRRASCSSPALPALHSRSLGPPWPPAAGLAVLTGAPSSLLMASVTTASPSFSPPPTISVSVPSVRPMRTGTRSGLGPRMTQTKRRSSG